VFGKSTKKSLAGQYWQNTCFEGAAASPRRDHHVFQNDKNNSAETNGVTNVPLSFARQLYSPLLAGRQIFLALAQTCTRSSAPSVVGGFTQRFDQPANHAIREVSLWPMPPSEAKVDLQLLHY
jgi:hypothetical protein